MSELDRQICPTWRRSTLCSGGTCVEVAITSEEVMVRDRANPDVVLRLSPWVWRIFIAGIKNA